MSAALLVLLARTNHTDAAMPENCMTCSHCGGLKLWRLEVTAEGDWSGWRCLNCGRQDMTVSQEVLKGKGARWLPGQAGSYVSIKSNRHCIHGHPFSEENTLIDSANRRRCKTCLRVQGITLRKVV